MTKATILWETLLSNWLLPHTKCINIWALSGIRKETKELTGPDITLCVGTCNSQYKEMMLSRQDSPANIYYFFIISLWCWRENGGWCITFLCHFLVTSRRILCFFGGLSVSRWPGNGRFALFTSFSSFHLLVSCWAIIPFTFLSAQLTNK